MGTKRVGYKPEWVKVNRDTARKWLENGPTGYGIDAVAKHYLQLTAPKKKAKK